MVAAGTIVIGGVAGAVLTSDVENVAAQVAVYEPPHDPTGAPPSRSTGPHPHAPRAPTLTP